MRSPLRRTLATLAVLSLLATACGTRDAELALRANPRLQPMAEAAATTGAGFDAAVDAGGVADDGFGGGTTVAGGSGPVTSGGTAGGGATSPSGTTTSSGTAGTTGTTGTTGTAGSTGSGGTGGTGSGSGSGRGSGSGSAASAGGGGAPAGGTSSGEGGTGSEGTPAAGAGTTGGCVPAKDTFRVGYIVTDAGGVGGLTGSDLGAVNTDAQEAEWEALLQWARDTGGLCGAEIEAIGETLGATSQEEERLATCVRFTEDHQVDFMLDTSLLTLSAAVVQCYHDHGVPIIGSLTTLDREFLSSVPDTIAQSGAALDRLMLAATLGPDSVGFYDGAKLGVIVREDPIFQRAYEEQVAPALASLGVTPVQVSAIASDGSTAPNVLLQMRSAGADHILFLGIILEWLAFANAAEAQGYRPRYAFGEYGEMAGVTAFYGPHAQLQDAVATAASTNGVLFVEPGEQPQPLQAGQGEYDLRQYGPGMPECLDILTEYTGTDYYSHADNSTQEQFICEHAMLLIEGARATPGELSSATLIDGIQALGTHEAVRHHSSRFGPGIQDGAEDYRVGVFNSDVNVYTAVSDWQGLPR